MKVYVVSCVSADGFMRTETCFDNRESAELKFDEVRRKGGYVPELGIQFLTLAECEYDYFSLLDCTKRTDKVLLAWCPNGIASSLSLPRTGFNPPLRGV